MDFSNRDKPIILLNDNSISRFYLVRSSLILFFIRILKLEYHCKWLAAPNKYSNLKKKNNT